MSAKVRKRWNSETVSPLWTQNLRVGSADLGLHHDNAAITFAALVTEFSYLEKVMERVFAQLLGTDEQTVKHLSKKIFSVSANIQMMRSLLHHAPRNSEKAAIFDELIDEFEAVSKLRNEYVHGLWEVTDDGEIYFVRPNSDPYGLENLVSKRFDLMEIEQARKRILDLWSKVQREMARLTEQ